jgi:endoglucanase
MKKNEITNSVPKIGKPQIALLEKLSNTCAVSGDEGAVRDIVIKELKEFADDLKVDALGNVLITRKSKVENPIRVLVAAHMDEVGFMLVDEDGDGLYRFEIVGGIDNRQLVGKPVLVSKYSLPGIIGAKPIHLASSDELHHPFDQKSSENYGD